MEAYSRVQVGDPLYIKVDRTGTASIYSRTDLVELGQRMDRLSLNRAGYVRAIARLSHTGGIYFELSHLESDPDGDHVTWTLLPDSGIVSVSISCSNLRQLKAEDVDSIWPGGSEHLFRVCQKLCSFFPEMSGKLQLQN